MQTPNQKPEELLIRLDERFASFEKSVTMMFDEMMLKHREILHQLEKKADMHLLNELEEIVNSIHKAQEDYQRVTNKRLRKYDQLIWKAAGALMVGGVIGGVGMTLLTSKLQDIL